MSSRSQALDNHATHSQTLGPLDSISLPSEPLDIRNLFSSYAYESPELNTLDGFQDFNGSGESLGKEVKNEESGENQSVGKCDDGLISAAKESRDGIVKFNESDELEYSERAAMVTGSSETLSLASEPPNIKNWFSSYVYESPTLDTTDDFIISDYKEREDDRVYCGQQNNKDVRDFVDIEESADLPSQTRISSVLAKCTNLDKKSVSKDNEISASDPVQTHCFNHGSVKKFINANEDDKDYDAKSLHKSIVKDSQENEDVTSGTLDLNVKRNSLRRPSDRRSTGKENEENGLLDNGFITTRKKSRHENTENVRAREGVQSQSLRNGVNRDNDAKVSRKVLSEKSIFHSSNNGNIVEITGKWRCPQKNKPDLGPPLKQLRLENWVRRL